MIKDISKKVVNFNQFDKMFFVARMSQLRIKNIESQYIVDGMVFSLYEERKDHFVFWCEYTPILLIHKK